MNQKIEETIGDYKVFLNKIFDNLKNVGFSLDELQELDHIAYRTESDKKYEIMKNKLTKFLSFFSEKMFGGRLILVGKLKENLIFENFSISTIELMAPKNGNKFKDGLEHAEFVINISLSKFLEKHKNINFNMDAYSRENNPELILEFKDCAIKFHEQSLLKVISL